MTDIDTPPDDDLLQPSLDASYDVEPTFAPWNPSTLVVWAAFCGPAVATILFGMNERRLGRAGRATWVFAGGLVLLVLTLAVAMWMASGGAGEEWRMGNSRARLFQRIVAAAAALAVAPSQRRLVRRYESSGGELAGFLPALAFAALGLIVHFGVILALAPLFPEAP